MRTLRPYPRRGPDPGRSRGGEETRGGGPSPIGELLGAILRTRGLGAPVRDNRVFEAWRRVAAPELGEGARPVRFRGGELVVEVESCARLAELETFTGEGLRRRLNAALGSEQVRTLVFKLRTR